MVASITPLDQAKILAEENRKGEPDVVHVYWFPDERMVRMLVLTEATVRADDGALHPFYFNASPSYGLPLPSGVALIRPDEFGKLQLPEGWPDWAQAQEL